MKIWTITKLASRIVTWCADCDRRLLRIYEYLHSHAALSLFGKMGCRHRGKVEMRVWPDADLAGDTHSTKSTSGRFVELSFDDGFSMPLGWAYKKHGATSNSTPEAETVSLAIAMREDAIPLQTQLSTLLGSKVPIRVFEDNEACITKDSHLVPHV